MELQENTHVEGGQEAKYEIGRALRFVEYSPDEAFSVSEWSSERKLAEGDIVRPVERNACGMGIDVIRESDGAIHMVWPEEVETLSDMLNRTTDKE